MKDWTRLKYDARAQVVLSGLQFTVSRVICAVLNRRFFRGENFICDKNSQSYRVTLNRGMYFSMMVKIFLAYLFHRHMLSPTKSSLMPLIYDKKFLSKKNWTPVDPNNGELFKKQLSGFPKVTYTAISKARFKKVHFDKNQI